MVAGSLGSDAGTFGVSGIGTGVGPGHAVLLRLDLRVLEEAGVDARVAEDQAGAVDHLGPGHDRLHDVLGDIQPGHLVNAGQAVAHGVLVHVQPGSGPADVVRAGMERHERDEQFVHRKED